MARAAGLCDLRISKTESGRDREIERLGLHPCPVKREKKKKRKEARGGQQVEETGIVTKKKKHLLKNKDVSQLFCLFFLAVPSWEECQLAS